MAIKAKVLLVGKHEKYDFKCFAVQNRNEADIVAFAVNSNYDSHELKIFMVDKKYDAQKKIYFVKSRMEL